MRLQHLDLTRYGKFTDRRLDFPGAERDFHVIIGPNEAGKSTVRAAVMDVLYGIPARTRHDFVHAMPDLRLGASLAQGPAVLSMQRVKGNKQTLRDLADKPLADGMLAPFLGSTDRDFFNQMFGLDHDRLVKGGHSILSASNDLGQILFQSAAGIAGLGQVRDELEAQADSLWSRRRSGERRYYMASDELDRAVADLKKATVRTKDWAEAQSRLTEVTAAHDGVRQQLAEVRRQRGRLERVRRVLSPLRLLGELSAEAAALGPVTALPEAAGQTLAEAERALATAQVEINHQTLRRDEAQAGLAAVVLDPALLAADAEITELHEQRLQYRAYAADMGRRQADKAAHFALASRLAAQLGWDATHPEALRDRIPSEPQRTALARLARAHSGLQQAADAAQRAVVKQQAELARAEQALAALPAAATLTGLQAALAQAQKLGDPAAAGQAAEAAVQRQQLVLDKALASLGQWPHTVAALRQMLPPTAELVQSLRQAQTHHDAQAKALAARLATLDKQCQQAELEARLYQGSHDAVTLAEVAQARQARDQTWAALRAGAQRLDQEGAAFEWQVQAADALADRRHDTAQAASELLARRAQAERAAQELAQARAEAAQLQAHAADRAQHWHALASACGLAALPLDAAPAWLEARQSVLAADAALADALLAQRQWQAAVSAACTHLTAELRAGAAVADATATDADTTAAESTDATALLRLTLQAQERVRAAAGLEGRRETLRKQLDAGQRDALPLLDEAQQARQALQQWATRWSSLVVDAGLDSSADVLAIETQLATLAELAQALDAARQVQTERIDKMQADLDQHAAAAQALAQRLRPTWADQDTSTLTLALAEAVRHAREAESQARRWQAEAAEAERRLRDAQLAQELARAKLAPLVQRAGLTSLEALPDAIARSDRQRELQARMALAERAVHEGGDGLGLDLLRAEAEGVDPDTLVAELSLLEVEEDRQVARLSELSAQRQVASLAVQAIAGTADAARAEAQRQQALASMADVVERYVKVFTAARLLRWSIEQYREAKQGPMLAAASQVFADLTLGSFDRLVVDFESDPPKLMGRRPNGMLVDIEGMSEGTRDQLYLALRLAALHEHLGHAQVLPFIADDLFVNFDDQRTVGGLRALGELSRKTQVLFLSHHDHLLPLVQQVFGAEVNTIRL